MTTIRTLAHDYRMQPYEVADALNLDWPYDENAELDSDTEATYRDALDIMAEQADVA